MAFKFEVGKMYRSGNIVVMGVCPPVTKCDDPIVVPIWANKGQRGLPLGQIYTGFVGMMPADAEPGDIVSFPLWGERVQFLLLQNDPDEGYPEKWRENGRAVIVEWADNPDFSGHAIFNGADTTMTWEELDE